MSDDTRSRTALIGAALLIALVLAAIILGITSGLQWYLSPSNDLSIVQRRDLVQGLASAGQALAVFLTGAVGLIGLFFTWQNITQARESTQRTLELAEQGQLTERFTRAIDQLGKMEDGRKVLEVRLGAIYALQRIAEEHITEGENDYYWPVIAILCAYVRENASVKLDKDPPLPPDEDPPEATELDVASDIAAVIDVLRNRAGKYDDMEPTNINLSYANLQLAFLQDAHLESANFESSKMWYATFEGAHLQGAEFSNADLRSAFFEGAYLEGAIFTNANLRTAMFHGTDLTEIRDVTQEQLDETFGDSESQPPRGLERPSDWLDKPFRYYED